VLFLCAVGLAARGFFGFDWTDESFYLSLVHRLYQGDGPLVHEWHPAQGFSVLLLPLYAAYVKLHGSTGGVVLFFRLEYVLFSLATACVLFHVLRRHGLLPALGSALLVLFYAKISLGTFSYNTLSVGFSVLSLSCVYGCVTGGGVARASRPRVPRASRPRVCGGVSPPRGSGMPFHRSWRWRASAVLAGVFFALAAWCMPTLLAVGAIGLAAMAAARLARGEGVPPSCLAGVPPSCLAGVPPARGGETGVMSSSVQASGTHHAGETPAPRSAAPRGVVWSVLAGGGLVAAGIAAYVLAASPLNDLSAAWTNVFRDPAHPHGNPLATLVRYAETLANQYGRSVWLAAAACAAYVAARRMAKKPPRPAEKAWLFFLGGAAATAACLDTPAMPFPTSHIVVAFSVWGLMAFLLTDRRNHNLFAVFYAPGVLFSLAHFFASNTELWAIVAGALPAACASMFFITDLANELRAPANQSSGKARSFFHHRGTEETEKDTGNSKDVSNSQRLSRCPLCLCGEKTRAAWPVLLAALMASAMLAAVAYERVVEVYRDYPLAQLTQRVDAGPAAGLYTAPARAAQYAAVRETLAHYANTTGAADENGNLFILNLLPWAYLDTDMRCGGFTTWRVYGDDARIEPYYRLHPSRRPDVILVLRPDIGQCLSDRPSPPQRGTLDGYLLQYALENGFEQHVVECGTVFRKRQ